MGLTWDNLGCLSTNVVATRKMARCQPPGLCPPPVSLCSCSDSAAAPHNSRRAKGHGRPSEPSFDRWPIAGLACDRDAANFHPSLAALRRHGVYSTSTDGTTRREWWIGQDRDAAQAGARAAGRRASGSCQGGGRDARSVLGKIGHPARSLCSESADVRILRETGEDMRMPRNSNDVLVKHLSTALPDGVLDVIGVHGVHIERALPTELDSVDMRQEFTDVVWELRSGSDKTWTRLFCTAPP